MMEKSYRVFRDMYHCDLAVKHMEEVKNFIQCYHSFENIPEVKEYIQELRNLLTVKEIKGGLYVRVGNDRDGGYVMADDFDNVNIAYSFGICDDVSWDLQIVQKKDCLVYMYDHTIEGLPEQNKNFHWEKMGICGEYSNDPKLKPLDEIIYRNGHTKERNMILKMDVEGAEWEVFSSISEEVLNQFDQIVAEFHGLLDFNKREIILKSLKSINRNFQLVHIHGNNGDFFYPYNGFVVPNVIEVTYVNKKKRDFIKSEKFFPTALDRPNSYINPEIYMGYWN